MGVTLKEVAARSGMHPATVSRALNPRTSHLLKEATVRKARSAARDLNYTPNALAAALRTSRSHMIGILLPTLLESSYSKLLQGVVEECRSHGYATVVASHGDEAGEINGLISEFAARGMDGVILIDSKPVQGAGPSFPTTMPHVLELVARTRSKRVLEKGRSLARALLEKIE